MVLETKDILHVCVQKFLVRERGKCWNWRASRYVPIGTRRKERFHMCLQERGGSVGNGGRRATIICAYLEKQKEEKRKEKDFENLCSRRFLFILSI